MTLKRLLSSGLLSVVLLCGVPPMAKAVTSYAYQGNDYTFFLGPYDSTMSLRMEIQFANPLAPNLSSVNVEPDLVAFGYFDGVLDLLLSAYDPADFSNFFMRLSTDANGDIVGWTLDITELVNLGRFDSKSFGEDRIINGSLVVAVSGVPGAWTLVPEPGSSLLLAMGLAALGWRARGKRP